MTSRVEEFHFAVADRSFGNAGPGARPARVIHDAIASTIYGGAARRRRRRRPRGRRRGGAAQPPGRARPRRLAPRRLRPRRAQRHPGQRPRYRRKRSRPRDDAAPRRPRRVRDRSRRSCCPRPRRVAVFVHGLCESDRSWSLFRETNRGRDLCVTPERGPRLLAAARALQHRPARVRQRRRAWPPCSRPWWRTGRWRSRRSRWWATRWAA